MLFGIFRHVYLFPISRDPPEGGTIEYVLNPYSNKQVQFPISRDPPEGGTYECSVSGTKYRRKFPISRDPPEGGTVVYPD